MEDPGLEELLLGARCELDREEISAAAGTDEAAARAFWIALGFPEVGAGEKAFTQRDLQALRTVLRLREEAVLDAPTLLVLARGLGQDMARTAEAHVEVLRARTADASPEEAVALMRDRAPEVLPALEQLVVHTWRRHFAAALLRSFTSTRDERSQAIGFVDLVDYTRRTRTWDAATLERTLERFEAATARRVTQAGGRVVKTLGDAVMYVVGDPEAAVEVALATAEAHEAEDELPQVCGGVAYGPVLVRLGDVYGEPVNLASRLADEARPGTVLVDEKAAEALAGSPALEVRRLKRRPVRGYRGLVPRVARRRGET